MLRNKQLKVVKLQNIGNPNFYTLQVSKLTNYRFNVKITQLFLNNLSKIGATNAILHLDKLGDILGRIKEEVHMGPQPSRYSLII